MKRLFNVLTALGALVSLVAILLKQNHVAGAQVVLNTGIGILIAALLVFLVLQLKGTKNNPDH